jgi:hypothetical protein
MPRTSSKTALSFVHGSPPTFFWIVGMTIFLWLSAAAATTSAQIQGSQKISETAGGFTESLDNQDRFGETVTEIGDVNGDGIPDLAVGAPRDDGDVCCTGAVWILLLQQNGTVLRAQKITDTAGGFTGSLSDDEFFGSAVAGVGDLDGNGVPDLAVGAERDDDGASQPYLDPDRGAVWILFLKDDGSVIDEQKISPIVGGLDVTLTEDDRFGSGLAAIGDLNGDGITELAVGMRNDDTGGADGAANRGAVWILFLNADGTVSAKTKIASNAGGFSRSLPDETGFGRSVAGLGDVDGDQVPDVAVGINSTNSSSNQQGAFWVLLLNANGSVDSQQRISASDGGFGGDLGNYLGLGDSFGWSVAGAGDLNGDGTPDVIAGAPADEGDGLGGGAAWILYLNPDGTVSSEQKISNTRGGFGGQIRAGERFGSGVSPIGDVNADGSPDLAVGASNDQDGQAGGAVWILFGDASRLPVELTRLDGTMDDRSVRLSWKTASETGNAGFEVQRQSVDGTSWTNLGFVEGGGTTSEAQTYRFEDASLPFSADSLQYRLKQVDTDGTTHLSDPVTIARRTVDEADLRSVYPNPTTRRATVEVAVPTEADDARLELFDLLGRTVRTIATGMESGRTTQTLEVSDLSPGVYFLRLRASGTTTTQKLTVVR